MMLSDDTVLCGDDEAYDYFTVLEELEEPSRGQRHEDQQTKTHIYRLLIRTG